MIGFGLMLVWTSSGDEDGLNGVVKDAYTGKPIAGAIVSTANATATTNGDGRFSVDDIAASVLSISREDYESTQVAITTPDARIEVQLRPTFVEGTVKNKRTGDPIANVTVTATGSNGETVSVLTDEDGYYRIDDVPPDANVAVSYEGFTVTSKPIGQNVKLDFEIRPDVLSGRITDLEGNPIEGAVVAIDVASAVTGADGTYRIAAVPESGTITVKKAGYHDLSAELPESLKFDASLEAFLVNALYVSAETAADDTAWAELLRIADETAVNAFVLDVKDDEGRVHYASQVELARQVQPAQPTYDLQARLRDMRDNDIYAIARVVVFKDPLLASSRPELAIHDIFSGEVWTTWDGEAWVNPHLPEVWSYNVGIAVEVAKAGFDEVQLDFVRFPTDGLLDNVNYGEEHNETPKIDAVTGFLQRAQEALKPTGAFVALNVEGLTLWDERHGGIGSYFSAVLPFVDVISPMVYPSHFYPGQLGFDVPNDHPFDVVRASLESAVDLVPESRDKLRPWLQDFVYGEGIVYGDAEVAAQVQAVNEFGAHGWMIWSDTGEYHLGQLAPE